MQKPMMQSPWAMMPQGEQQVLLAQAQTLSPEQAAEAKTMLDSSRDVRKKMQQSINDAFGFKTPKVKNVAPPVKENYEGFAKEVSKGARKMRGDQ